MTNHLMNFIEALSLLRKFDMMLNPEKCAFDMHARKFLGHHVITREIEADPHQIQALQELPTPSTTKQVQKLTGRLAALEKFIAKFSNKLHPFFTVLKQAKKFN